MHKIIPIIFFLFFTISPLAQAQKKKNKKDRGVSVSAKIEVLMEGNYSKAALTEKAIETARIKAIGDQFGYVIVQGISTSTKTIQGKDIVTSSTIQEVSNTLVKGEWVADDEGFPKTRFVLRDKGQEQEIWLICEVKGRARAVEEAEVDFESYAYNCQEPEKCNQGMFNNHDSMFLYFKTPVSGYLSVFMLEEGLVYRLLPYAQMEKPYESSVPVKSDEPYYLFSPEHRDYFEGFALVDEYGLVTYEDGQPLNNLIYVVFSSTPFQKPLLLAKDGIKYCEKEVFQEWLNKNRGLDKNFQVKKFSIVVNN